MSIRIFGQHDEATVQQIHRCMAVGGTRAVLCADGHKGYAQPIGGVVAYKGLISISGVGFDIACGNLAIRTDAKLADVRGKIAQIMDDVTREISLPGSVALRCESRPAFVGSINHCKSMD